MLRRLLVVATVAAGLAPPATADLSACGDKYVRMGRSTRSRGYAAVHPASILVYQPTNSKPKDVKEFDALLKRAGHRPVFLKSGAGLHEAFAAAKYDVVIAIYSDAEKIKEQLQSVPSKPGLLPILPDEPTKAVEAEAAKQYHCLIRPYAMTKYDALAQIDELMEMRLKGVTQ